MYYGKLFSYYKYFATLTLIFRLLKVKTTFYLNGLLATLYC